MDFEKAFDSINRKVMWQTLVEYQLPTKIINIIKEMYEGCECQVLHEGKLTKPIQVNSGVRQGCILSPILFLLVLDGVMRKVMEKRKRGLQWGLQDRLEDLDFADDICLLSQRYRDMEIKLVKLQREAEDAGLQINVNKTKEMRINSDIEHRLSINGKDIEQVESYILGVWSPKMEGQKRMSETELGKRMVPSYSCILYGRTEISPGKPNLDSLIAVSDQFSCMVVKHGRSQNRLPTSCKFSLITVYDVLLIGDGQI
jgi:hypothetical protein